MSKEQMRQLIKHKLNSISKPDYEDKSFRLAQTLFSDEQWKLAKCIGITVSNYPEVDTYQIIRKAWEEGKVIAVPKCIPDIRGLDFRILTSFSQLELSFHELYEPNVNKTVSITKEQIDLLIVPGLAFTKSGERLGYGGGYFDRFLTDYLGYTISLAFHEQLVPTLPLEKNDLPVKKIFSEEEVFRNNE